MRIWSLHPGQLDRIGLVACWRESLLAQAVLAERTRGYRHHPQLERFRAQPDPVAAIGAYLSALADEADARGYRFDRTRVIRPGTSAAELAVTEGQLALEWAHLGARLAVRSPDVAERWRLDVPTPHPLFHVVPGPIESWERARMPEGGPST
ncbi:pyrimidine dimer DNA glycosylase/endonuclease V [Microbacterium sp.]|uniref:pyrimidine dimer DNA glycosylase/endonuclease V n=1 Tax=Microbacterium sp. TaxID=51671 RepID=UPI002811239C|nr:pyrimidine dimer DNA glycosylase/endonuclease V [Microbacterium sp.]